MDAGPIELKVLKHTDEEKSKFVKENPWHIAVNTFLVRVVRYLYQDKETVRILETYVQLPKTEHNEEHYKMFKNLETHLMGLAKCNPPNKEIGVE